MELKSPKVIWDYTSLCHNTHYIVITYFAQRDRILPVRSIIIHDNCQTHEGDIRLTRNLMHIHILVWTNRFGSLLNFISAGNYRILQCHDNWLYTIPIICELSIMNLKFEGYGLYVYQVACRSQILLCLVFLLTLDCRSCMLNRYLSSCP